MESSKKSVIVYTDHGASLGIVKQSTLITTCTNKLNLKHIRASEYLQRFSLDIRHKPGVFHYVLNTLSRLFIITPARLSLNEYEEEFDIFAVSYFYSTTLVEISKEFKNKILLKYTKNKVYTRIKNTLKKKLYLTTNATRLLFELKKGFIYKVDSFTSNHAYRPRRLCLFSNIVSDILKIIYSEGHPGHAKLYKIINSSWFIYNLIKHFREFLRYCSECLIFQTKRYKPYGFL